MRTVDPLHARSQGAVRNDDGSVVWRVWAPSRKEVRIITWRDGKRTETPMVAEEDGYFSHQAADIPDGFLYQYRVSGIDLDLPDPASRWQPQGVHRPSAVFTPGQYLWNDADWRGVQPRDLVLYELHVGTFTPAGTFEAIIPRLPELVDLGITAIELMPVSQFPGERNWGYDGVHPYAAQNSYGGPLGLQKLVDAAHQAGMGVLLDCVYNHLGPEGNYLGMFGPYFTDRYHTPWGQALNYDGPASDAVRKYVVDNAAYWIREFHLDGLRLDAVQTIYDLSAHHLLAEIQEAVQEVATQANRSVVVIAETNQNDTRLTNEPEQGGYGLSGVWSDDFHHSVHALLTGERDGYYSDFGSIEQLAKCLNDVFVYDGCYSPYYKRRQGCKAGNTPREKFTVCIQNHDQIGNRARGERLSTLLEPPALRLAAALMSLSPFTPMLYMGEEYAEDRPFAFFCSFLDQHLIDAVRSGRQREFAELSFKWGGRIPDPFATTTFAAARPKWEWPAGTPQAGLRAMYRHLLHARRQWPALWEDATQAKVGSAGEPHLIFQRGEGSPLIAWVNFSAQPLPVKLDPPGPFLFSTEEQAWHGSRTVPPAERGQVELLPWELIVWGDAQTKKGEA